MEIRSTHFENDMVSARPNEEKETKEREESILSQAGRILFYAFIALMPVWFLPTTTIPLDLNKAFFGSIVATGALMLAVGGMLQEGRIRFLRSRFFSLAIVFGILWCLSGIFSQSPTFSIWGFGTEPLSVVHVILALVVLFATPLLIQTKRQMNRAIEALGFGMAIAILFFFIQGVFNVSIFGFDFAEVRSFNLFGSWNALALLFGFGVALLLPFVDGSRPLSSMLFGVLLVGVFLTNFTTAWILLGIISLLFVALALALREQRGKLFALSLLLLLLSTLFLLLGGALGTMFNESFDSFGRPNEVRPSLDATIAVTTSALKESPLFGSGPGTFGLGWEKFKNPEININPVFSQVRFASGYNMFATLVTEGGILPAFFFLLLLGSFVWNGVRLLGDSRGESGLHVQATFAGGLFLVLAWFLYPLNFTLVLFTFLVLGLFYASLREAGLVRPLTIRFFETKERGFVFSLLLIFVLVGGIAGIYYESTRYLGQLAYARGLEKFNDGGEANAALEQVRRAALLDPRQDRYFRTAAQLEFVKMQRALVRFNQGSLTQPEMLENFSAAYNAGRNDAESALRINPYDSENYRMLGQLYELAIPFDVNIATDALENFEKAKELSPSNPLILVEIARTHLAISDVTLINGGGTASQRVAGEHQEQAIKFLNDALALQPTLTQAHFTLSQLYANRNQLPDAIERARSTVRLVPNDIGALFQLGLLLYQQESYVQAKPVFEEAIRLAPNYSNARYFLGLIYDREGKGAEALIQFEEIAKLNPDDPEVQAVITALKEGKRAQDVLSEPPPEDRRDPPLDDTTSEEIPAP